MLHKCHANAARQDAIFLLSMSCHKLSLQRRGLPHHWNPQLLNADLATLVNNLMMQEREQDPSDSCVDLTLQSHIPLLKTANRSLGVQDGRGKGKVEIKASLHTEGKTNLI